MKRSLQEKIDSGEIGDMSQLLAYVGEQGWSVVRNGVDYLGVENAEGKRFRVRFPFVNHTREARTKVSRELNEKRRDSLAGYWIYGLLAEHGEDRACYIGQAVDYVRRVKDHIRGREGRSSWDLARWAEARGVAVEFALLEFVPGQPRSHGPASAATVIEGLWLRRALAAGFQAPGMERWGGLPRPGAGVDLRWPEDEVAEARRPLALVIPDRLLPAQVAIRRARKRYATLEAMQPTSTDGT
ncbi:GIY-YIG nuclease family protein [Pelagibacterium flavum]|uniref:GIY-YIG nuclease family protein n=1 Tax=Pelagibacterium flavum TaxID=2984530 RepID=A0ABY6IS53_9HYPH|nr:GIY-YIG nuclease family protein [Pelagibacterium sp. YIM 151497]UYQ73403.1 GIY-YIG nuclease family protein [Pelagibacterium sp. YIM 151497]